MRIKLDENMPVRLVAPLVGMGNDVETVYSERLSGVKDEKLWSVAQAEQRLLITQDLDFSDNRRFQPGSHHGIILVRLRRPGHVVRIFTEPKIPSRTHKESLWAIKT